MYSDNINDSDLGNLTWNSEKEYWTGEAEISPGQKVKILIDPKGGNEQAVLGNARSEMNNIKNKNQEFKQKASDSLLDTYNKSWNDGKKKDGEEFIQELKLSEISLIHNMGATLYYEAGNLFKGHAIEVRLNNDGSFSEAVLAG